LISGCQSRLQTVADASMEARVLGPGMINNGGYSRVDTAAAIAFSFIITATIPPGI
jgi:TRAP-type transport system large permease protein